ncbi:MAG TPA: VOC family protein [Planctomycetota bacterium]|jgi:uncharacterized glyoxalase superfamily protein PhnB
MATKKKQVKAKAKAKSASRPKAAPKKVAVKKVKAKPAKVNWRPKGYSTVTPALTVRGGAEAIEFYKKAFGAVEVYRMPGPDGKVMHAQIRIGDSALMLGEEAVSCGHVSPLTLNGTPFSLFIYVPDADAAFDQAIEAGAAIEQPVKDMFWGDRVGIVKDPFGHKWWIGTHKEELSGDEIRARAEEAMAEHAATSGT